MTEKKEPVVLVDESGRSCGVVSRGQAHGNPALLHAAVHVLVHTSEGNYVLQKRASTKDVAPGLWDTSVGGHVVPGETAEEAARREMEEELGVGGAVELLPVATYVFRGAGESEYVTSFDCRHDGPFRPNPEEIEEIGVFPRATVVEMTKNGRCTPHFAREIEVVWGAGE